MTWQPIKTAPRDGTEFLAFDSRTRKMDVAEMRNWGRAGWVCCAVQSDGELGPGTDEFGHHPGDVTHWQPLPAHPVNDSEEEK